MKHLEETFAIANFAAQYPHLLGVTFEKACDIVSKLPTPNDLKEAIAYLTAYNFYITGLNPVEVLKSDEDVMTFAMATFEGLMKICIETNHPIPEVIAVAFWTFAAFICNDPY
jgi:hypothetical protein